MNDFDLLDLLDVIIRILLGAILFAMFLIMFGFSVVVIRAAFSGDLIAAIQMLSRL